MRRVARQLKLPLPRPSKADRKAYILDRLDGYEFRQAAREAKRREAAARRARREKQADAPAAAKPRQLGIPGALSEVLPSSTGTEFTGVDPSPEPEGE